MSERYVDLIGLSVLGYGDAPLPQHIEEGWGMEVDVGGQVDREAIRSEIQAALDDRSRQGHPYELTDRYTYFSWGADAATLLIVIGTTLASVAAAIQIAEAIGKRLGKWAPEPSREGAPELARRWLARQLQIREEEIRLEGVEPTHGGFAVTVLTPYGPFRVEVLAGAIFRVKRLKAQGND